MKLITAIVRPERLSEVEAALFRAGATGMMLTPVSGRWTERDVDSRPRADAAVPERRHEVLIQIECADPLVEQCIDAILSAAHTDEEGEAAGDGRIYVQPLDRVVRIRTGERYDSASSPATADDVERRARAQLQDTLSWNTAEQKP